MADFELFARDRVEALARRLTLAEEGRYCRQRRDYLLEFLRHGADGLMKNGRGTRAFVATVGSAVVPLVVNDGDVDDCYLVSSRAHYILYMIFEMERIRPRWKSWPLQRILAVLGEVVTRAGFNRQVSVNNWLLTTSPENPLGAEELRVLTRGLRRSFPDHALVMRGVDPRQQAWVRTLAAEGYELIVHRPVHEWDPSRLENLSANQRRTVRKELALLDDGPFGLREPGALTPAEAERVAWLYETLYIEKHCALNAHFNATYFDAVTATGISPIALLHRKDDGELSAFVTHFEDPARLVFSLVGYDPTLPRQRFPCYRTTLAFMLRGAMKRGKPLFLSTGAASIKRRRGTYEWVEHEAYFVRHLSVHRRVAWHAVAKVLGMAAAGLDSSQI